MLPNFLHYFSAILALGLATIGGGLGQGLAGMNALQAMERQQLGRDNTFKAMLIGLALIESGIVIALVMSLLMLLGAPKEITLEISLSELGIGLAIGLAALSTSIASSFVVSAATQGIGRQPFFAQKIITLMLLCQSIIEAPVLFSFIISLLIKTTINDNMVVIDGVKNLAAGLVIGLASIGPSIGQALFCQAACTAVSANKNAYNKIFPFALFGQAFIETPIIFCLLLALMFLFYVPTLGTMFFPQGPVILTAAVTLGLGALGTGAGIGLSASRSCEQIAQEPNNYPLMIKLTLLTSTFIESSVIYAMIVSFLLILKISS